MKNFKFNYFFNGVLLLGLTGCTALMAPQTSTPPPATRAEVEYLRNEVRSLRDRQASAESELGRFQSDTLATRSSQTSFASSAQVNALQTQLEDLQRQLRAMDAARVQDKKEIYDDISKKIATLLKSAQTQATPSRPTPTGAPSRPRGNRSGIEHVVQPGESLSKIASAYGKKMSQLVEENGLSSPDNIRVGQKLFIPD